MILLHIPALLAAARPQRVGHAALGRRALLSRSMLALGASAVASPARAILGGEAVTNKEAASAGAVGLYIDVSGCSVCRKDIPATCSGTLVGPDLVLSARHCIDVPRELNGTLTKVVFGADIRDARAPSRAVEKIVTTADYGINSDGSDLVLIKLSSPAPPEWRPVELPLGLLPAKAEEAEAKRLNSPFYPDGLGFPQLVTYGYGQQSTDGAIDANDYSAGSLRRLPVQARTEIRPWAPAFLATPTSTSTGTCAGDSGGAALAVLQDPQGRGLRQLLLGVQALASIPCEDNQAIYVYPDAFGDFLRRASADLGSPLRPTLSWRDYVR